MPALCSGARCKSPDRAPSLAERRSEEGVGPAPVRGGDAGPSASLSRHCPSASSHLRFRSVQRGAKGWPALERVRQRLRQRPRSNQLAIIPEPAGPPAGDGVYLSLAAAADLLGVTLAELRQCIRLGKLETVRMGDQVLVRRGEPGPLSGADPAGRRAHVRPTAVARQLDPARSPVALSAGGGSSAQAQASNYQGPDWNLDSFVNGDVASSALAATVITLAFEPGRASLTGTAGCNRYMAQVDAGEGRFTARRLGQPRCPALPRSWTRKPPS